MCKRRGCVGAFPCLLLSVWTLCAQPSVRKKEKRKKEISSRCSEDFNSQSASVRFGDTPQVLLLFLKHRFTLQAGGGQKKQSFRRPNSIRGRREIQRDKVLFFFSSLFYKRAFSEVKHQQKLLDHPGTGLPWPLTPISLSHPCHMDGRCSSASRPSC